MGKVFPHKAVMFQVILLAFPCLCYAQRSDISFLDPGDSTMNYYFTLTPASEPKGTLIILPGFYGAPGQILAESEIPVTAQEAGYRVILPALGDQTFFYIDDQSHEILNRFVAHVFEKYRMKEDSFFIGGMSFGGTMAIQYTQRAYMENSGLKKPAGVFGIDPPLDLERLYTCMTTTNRPEKSAVSLQEDINVVNRIRTEFGTNPADNPVFFWNISPYAKSDPNHDSLKSIANVPIRIYNEPDINWYIQNRRVDYSCMNIIDSAGMINWLTAMGNTQAELVTTSEKGYRANGNRHPHSWSIADAQDVVAWMDEVAASF